MNPMAIMAITSMLPHLKGIFGSDQKQGSTFSQGQQGGYDDLLKMIQGMGGQGDITQNQGYQQGQDYLNNLYSNDQGFWDQFEAPIQRQFQEETVPDLANRFASQGSGGSLGSTGFRNQLAREGSNLHEKIAALRGGMRQQGLGQQMNYAQQPTQNYLAMLQQALGQGTNNYVQNAQGGLFGPAAGQGLGAFASEYGGQQARKMFAGQNQSTM